MEQWPVRLLLAFILGAVIGLEREINERKDIIGDKSDKKTALLGLRSFSLVAGLGAITGLLHFHYPILSAITAIGFVALLIAFYIFDSRLTLDIGITTEVALFYSFLIGLLLALNVLPMQVIVALAVVLTLLMSRKERIKDIIEDISQHEVNAFVSFALLAFVILPFLPNVTYALSDIPQISQFLHNLGWNLAGFADLELFNPFKLWFIVVLITGVDLLGYVMERLLGAKSGWLVTSLIGGFVSSTATTVSIAEESRSSKRTRETLVSGAIFATMVSFFPILFLLAALNVSLFTAFAPILLILVITSLIIGVYFMSFAKNTEEHLVDEKKIVHSHKIFDIVSAFKFAGIFLLINIGSKIALALWGDAGFLLTTALGALTGIDAVVINAAQLVGTRIDMSLGVWSLLLANTVNLFAKSMYAYLQGSRDFAMRFFISMCTVVGTSIAAAFLLGF